jgi:hypothetical protein
MGWSLKTNILNTLHIIDLKEIYTFYMIYIGHEIIYRICKLYLGVIKSVVYYSEN